MKRALRRARVRSRLLLTATAAILVAAAIPNLAGAGHQNDPPVPSFTGCLSNPEGGRFYSFQVGDGPASCHAGDPQVHLSGGDSTAVAAGPGLEGGASEGAAVLRLKTQSCNADDEEVAVGFGRAVAGQIDCTRLQGFVAIDVKGSFGSTSLFLMSESCPPEQFVTGVQESDGENRYLECAPAAGSPPLPFVLNGNVAAPGRILVVRNNGTGGGGVFNTVNASAPALEAQNDAGGVHAQIGGCFFISMAMSCTGGKGFRIDHPLDPVRKWLSHWAIEAPELLNVYSGNVTTNARGVAVVWLPRYFQALNRDFRYQLTVIGSFAQAIVAKEIAGNRFTIRTSKPGVKVSWQVTGVRHDAYARSHPFRAEAAKTAAERATSSSGR